ncbi:hypothetical protein [Propionivibrio dicarboxylicus]|uniref:Uncharacterized protein n=1 Tax=Propionivibrio dicarboxylicus TaxID=83767 RepID=A0A1G8AHT9_9RHOO|nr:hypothetical protein [Propionivibrio dicarboxylicus]SDH20544.1 hypothetical protein SAMN05660652_01392 [Propionivibrio dicarboxylicus]
MGIDRDRLQASVRAALACPDARWYRQMLAQDASGCPLSEDEADGVVQGAMAAAVSLAEKTRRAFPGVSAEALAAALQLEIVPMPDDAGLGNVPLIGQYQPGARQIRLHEQTLARIEDFIRAQGLEALTPASELRPCVLYHEIFHALEEATPGIYTRSAMLQRRWFGVWPRRRGLASASEIGAIHYSRIMSGIAYSPRLFECYLLLDGRAAPESLPGEFAGVGKEQNRAFD